MPKFSLLFGGVSYEHEISIISAITLKNILPIEHFIFLDASHRLYLIPQECMRADFFAKQEFKKLKALNFTHGGFSAQGFLSAKTIAPECLINLIHGADGEDGTLACMLDFYQIPFIGPRAEACVLSFHKAYTKAFCAMRKVRTLPYDLLSSRKDFQAFSLPLPLIIKPARLGSSIGISILKDQKDLDYALDSGFEYDDCVVAEPFISGVKEYNLAGFKADGKYHFSIIEEPQKSELLDFDKKYLDFSRQEKVHAAHLEPSLQTQMQEIFKKVYENTFEGALIRCDFFVHEGQIYLNEINPIPGSLAHYLFKDFHAALNMLANSLPKKRKIHIDYNYINKIKKAK